MPSVLMIKSSLLIHSHERFRKFWLVNAHARCQRNYHIASYEKAGNLFLTFYFVLGYSQLTNNVVLASCDQLRDSAIHIHVSIPPQIPLPSRLPCNIEQSSIYCTVDLCYPFTHSSVYMSIPNFLTIPFHPQPSLWRLGIFVESESCSSPWNIACFSGTVCGIRLQIFCSRRKEVVLSSSQRDTGGTDSWQPLRSQFQKIYWGQTPWGSDHFPRRKRGCNGSS